MLQVVSIFFSVVGLLNPLDCPHHTKSDEDSLYREGVVLDKPVKEKKGSFVYVGLLKEVQIDKKITPGVRVTVEMLPTETGKFIIVNIVLS